VLDDEASPPPVVVVSPELSPEVDDVPVDAALEVEPPVSSPDPWLGGSEKHPLESSNTTPVHTRRLSTGSTLPGHDEGARTTRAPFGLAPTRSVQFRLPTTAKVLLAA